MEQVTHNHRTSQVRALQIITIAWMILELCVAMYSGFRSHSIALTAFGIDSGIELLSAIVVLWRFASRPLAERRAARFSGFLLYMLALYIFLMCAANLLGYSPEAKASRLGIGLLISAAIVMPLLGRTKKTLAQETRSRALRADAAQSNTCAYMSWIALAGLLFDHFYNLHWADSLAALLLLPIVLKEANEASKGEVCDCS